jgi:hypothetical protein
MNARGEIQGQEFVKQVTGDFTVFPGHALVLAYEILCVYPNVDEALKKAETESLSCPAAVADSRISGGGGETHDACDLLRRAKAGEDIESLIDWADDRWVMGLAGGHVQKVEPGLEQAEKLKAEFRARLPTWIAV